jgi:hypothetical protein
MIWQNFYTYFVDSYQKIFIIFLYENYYLLLLFYEYIQNFLNDFYSLIHIYHFRYNLQITNRLINLNLFFFSKEKCFNFAFIVIMSLQLKF